MDDDRIGGLYRQQVAAARALAVAVTGDPFLAEDVVQDAFVRCALRVDRLRDPYRFGGYLMRAVVRTAQSQFRRRAAERRALGRYASTRLPQPEEAHSELVDDGLLRALRTLPPRQRTAVAARFLLDWSEAQTAQAMRCRIGTVKSLTSRGLVNLRAALQVEEPRLHD